AVCGLAVDAVASLADAVGCLVDRCESVHAKRLVGTVRALVAGGAPRASACGRRCRKGERRMTTQDTATAAAPLLQARGIIKRFGKFVALHGVDLQILPGTVHSVIGPNGAGKTTLFHTLTGTLHASEGSIVFDGHDVTHEADHQRVQRGIARSFQVTSLFANLSVRENLRLAAQGVHRAGAFDCWHPPSGARAHADIVDTSLERMGLTRLAQVAAGALSHGQQRRL